MLAAALGHRTRRIAAGGPGRPGQRPRRAEKDSPAGLLMGYV